MTNLWAFYESIPVTELCEYAANVDIPIARESIRAVGKIALQQYDVNAIVDRLLQFLEMEKDYVTAETLVRIFSKYVGWKERRYKLKTSSISFFWFVKSYNENMETGIMACFLFWWTWGHLETTKMHNNRHFFATVWIASSSLGFSPWFNCINFYLPSSSFLIYSRPLLMLP